MLELMRRHARNWLMKLLLGIIIVVFVFYFGSLREHDKTNIIATIDGKALPYADFLREYQNLTDIYRQRLGGNLTDDVLKKLGLKEQAVDSLIKQAIISEKSKELNIQVSDEELRDSIISYPAFQRNGVFDQNIYEQTLHLNKLTPETFEAQQRKFLTTAKLQDLILSGVHVSDGEIFDLYRLQNEKINLSFVKFSSKDYREAVKPTRQELETYLKEHGNELRVPEQVQLKYITFSADDFAPSANITETEIREYYDRNKERLVKPGGQPPPIESVKAMIAAQLKQISGMRKAAEAAKKAHDAIYQSENFDAYAAEKGLKIHTTPLFPTTAIPREFSKLPDFSRIAFTLQKNEISSVLSGETDYSIFQLVSKKPPYVPSLSEAGKEIESSYVESKAKLMCEKEAQGLLARLKKGEGLEKIAREKGLKVEETGLFLPGSTVPALGNSKELADALMQLSDAKPYPDKAFQINGGFAIVHFKGRGQVDETAFVSHKEELKRLLREIKSGETMSNWIEGVKEALIKEGRLKITKDIKGI